MQRVSLALLLDLCLLVVVLSLCLSNFSAHKSSRNKEKCNVIIILDSIGLFIKLYILKCIVDILSSFFFLLVLPSVILFSNV